MNTENTIVRTRIAPSPTGIAHVGTAYIALFNYAFALQHKGNFIIRIEDTDRQRFVEGAEQVIYDAMAWLGIPYEEAPDKGGPYAPYRQSDRLEIYHKYAEELIEKGHAYYCFCSPSELDEMRKEQQKAGKLPMYDGRCRKIPLEQAKERAKTEKHVVRLHMPEEGKSTWHDLIRGEIEFENALVDDQVLLKSDGFPTYHLAVVIDDHLMEITHILRGEEWISSTPKHLVLYDYFGWEKPQYAHMPLLRNPDHSKLSKRKNDVSITSYMEKGYLPEALLNFLALLGWSHPQHEEVFSLQNFLENFTIYRMQKTGPVFDLNKLNWMNGLYIREKITESELINRLKPFIPHDFPLEKLTEILPLIKERLVVLYDFESLTDFFYREFAVPTELLLKKTTTEELRTQLKETISLLEQKEWSLQIIEVGIRELQEQRNWKKSQYFMMLRVAVTGKTATPPLFETMQVLGKEKTLKRLRAALSAIEL